MTAPFFIVGASRSGTTVLRLMLNVHSRLAVPDELKYFRHINGQHDLTAWQTPLSTNERHVLVRGYLAARGDVFPGTSADLETRLFSRIRTARSEGRTGRSWPIGPGVGAKNGGERKPRTTFSTSTCSPTCFRMHSSFTSFGIPERWSSR